MKGVITHGMDISLNHGAVVQLRNGELDGFWYYTDLAGSAARSKEHGERIKIPTPTKQPDKQFRSAIRLDWVIRWLDRTLSANRPDYSCLEDYALGADQGAHYIGEIGGAARRMLWTMGVQYRLHDPVTVKLFVTHDGTAHKDLVEECVEDRWGVNFSAYNPKPTKRGKENRQTSEDLADAYGMARMVWVEQQLRAGLILLSDLSLKEIQVFNRITKAYPVNILGREWICNPDPPPRYRSCGEGKCGLGVLNEEGVLRRKAKRGIDATMKRYFE